MAPELPLGLQEGSVPSCVRVGWFPLDHGEQVRLEVTGLFPGLLPDIPRVSLFFVRSVSAQMRCCPCTNQ